MKKINRSFLLILASAIPIILLIFLILPKNDGYNLISTEQISDILDKENLTKLGVDIIHKDNIPVTIISYLANNEIGIIEAMNINGELNYTKSLKTHINKGVPIEVLGVNGGLKYVVVTFFDSEIRNKTNQLLISYEDRQKLIDYSTKNDRSLIIPVDDLLTNISTQVEFEIDFMDINNDILYKHPSKQNNFADKVVNNYYDYLFSKKSLDLLNGNTTPKISINLKENNFNTIYDLWLYLESVQHEENESHEILLFLDNLRSETGHYFASQKEKDESKYISLKSTSYLLDTKMALEILQSLNTEIPYPDEISNYLETVISELNNSNLDFISKASFIVMIDDIIHILEESYGDIFYLLRNLHDIQDLYNDTPPSIDKYSTALDVTTRFEKLDFKLDINEKEVFSYLESVQTSVGLFNIDGYTSNYDTLSTYMAIKILVSLELPIPNKEKMISSLNKIKELSLPDVNLH